MAENQKKKVSDSDGRSRTWAFIFYPDPDFPFDLVDRLSQMHLVGCISPYHDLDSLPTGELKKPHYHVFLQFDGKKSYDQVCRISWAAGVKLDDLAWGQSVLPFVSRTLDLSDDSFSPLYVSSDDSARWPSCSTIPIIQNSTRGACRYWCHLDNPDKAQYSEDDVRSFGGFDYFSAIEAEQDFEKMAIEIERFIDDNHVVYYSALARYARDNRGDWHRALRKGLTIHITQYLKSHEFELRRHGENAVEGGVTAPDPDHKPQPVAVSFETDYTILS